MCSQDDATSAIRTGLVRPNDFLVAVEKKYQRLKGEIKDRKFEVILVDNVIKVWAALSKKDVLAKINLLIQNLNYARNEAWKAGYGRRGSVVGVDEDRDSGIPLTSGIGENYDENDKLALKSDSQVAKLSDADVLRSWIATFLLGDPSQGGGVMKMDTTSLGI